MNGSPGSLRQWARAAWLASWLLAAVPTLAQVAAPDLWTKRDMPQGLTSPPEVVKSIAVDVNVASLRSNVRLSLLMPDGGKLLTTRTRLVNTPKGFVWSGTIDHEAIGTASFSVVNETVVGSILTGKGQSFRVRRDVSGVYLLEEIDLRKVPPEGEATSAPGPRDHEGNDPTPDTCTTDSGDDIDVMVVYTPAARNYAGVDALEAQIYLAVEQTNESYINSAIAQRLRLVHVAEVSYAESGNSSIDRDRLQQKADGFMDGVHSLRDSHGADLVLLITETLDNCGESLVMETVGNAFEDRAFSVVKRNCMSLAGKYSFAHELGHSMAARHDWTDDGHLTPYVFNHGHVEKSPTTGSPWRTVMAYDTLCVNAGVACPRVLNWSNPNISIGGTPTGEASGPHPEDNHRVLNSTARTVANFRCASPNRSDTWMKDTWSDTGSEPDPAQAGQPMWESPYIWVRNAPDPARTHQHEHQNPLGGQQNFIYVKLHNGGAATSGKLEVRVANATLGLAWPGNWTMVPPGPVTVALAANTTGVVEVPWTPAASGHFCLVARWSSASDPMTTPEGSNIEANVRGNNNIVWRNVELIDLGGDGAANADAALEVTGAGAGRAFVIAIRPVPARRPDGPRAPGFLDFGRIVLTLDDRLMEAWRRNSYQGTGLRREGSTVIVLDPSGAQLTLGALTEPGQARIAFSRTKDASYPRDEFGWRVIQSQADGPNPPSGGITYQVRTFAP